MKDEFDELWKERQELLNIQENTELECLCDDFGQDECPIHSTRLLDMIMMTEEEIEKLSKTKRKKETKTR